MAARAAVRKTVDTTSILPAIASVLMRFPSLPQRLKDRQIEVLSFVLQGRDTFAVLPTGYGKSLIYYLLPLLHDELYPKQSGIQAVALIISPLTQLIESQVRFLNEIGLVSQVLSSAGNIFSIRSETSHLFSSPEAILSSNWRHEVQNRSLRKRIVCLVIDEVHCITEW